MGERDCKITEYGRLMELVARKSSWDRPEQLSDEDLVAFLQVEHTEHIVGSMYMGGVSVVDGVYREIARRLTARTAARDEDAGAHGKEGT